MCLLIATEFKAHYLPNTSPIMLIILNYKDVDGDDAYMTAHAFAFLWRFRSHLFLKMEWPGYYGHTLDQLGALK